MKKKLALEKKALKERIADTRKRKDALKTKSEWMKDAQKAFNTYIRARDRHKSCISCDNSPNDNDLMTGSRWDAGHYRSRGSSPELRFNEDNCFKQCVKCNRQLSGNIVNMRLGILKRIGQERLDIIESKHDPLHLTIDDIKEIKEYYKQLLKEISLTPS